MQLEWFLNGETAEMHKLAPILLYCLEVITIQLISRCMPGVELLEKVQLFRREILSCWLRNSCEGIIGVWDAYGMKPPLSFVVQSKV